MSNRFCILCRFGGTGPFPRCAHPESVRGPDPVSGLPQQNWTCDAQRSSENYCGQSGKWFVKREEVAA